MSLPVQQCGYSIIYVDPRRQEAFCPECAEDRGEELQPHLLEGEEPVTCSHCGCVV